MARTGWKWLEITGMAGIGKNDQKWSELAGNAWKWMEWLKMPENLLK